IWPREQSAGDSIHHLTMQVVDSNLIYNKINRLMQKLRCARFALRAAWYALNSRFTLQNGGTLQRLIVDLNRRSVKPSRRVCRLTPDHPMADVYSPLSTFQRLACCARAVASSVLGRGSRGQIHHGSQHHRYLESVDCRKLCNLR